MEKLFWEKWQSRMKCVGGISPKVLDQWNITTKRITLKIFASIILHCIFLGFCFFGFLGLKQQIFIFVWFWRLKVWNQGAKDWFLVRTLCFVVSHLLIVLSAFPWCMYVERQRQHGKACTWASFLALASELSWSYRVLWETEIEKLNAALGLGIAAWVYLDEYKNPNLLSRLLSLRSKSSTTTPLKNILQNTLP